MRIIALGLIAILLLGCTSPEGQSPPPPADNSTQPPSQPPAPGTAPPSSPPPAPPATPPPVLPGTNPYSGMTLESIASSGDSVECDITFTYQNKAAQAKFYMKGTDEMRFEETSSGVSQCTKTITVIRETRKYVGCEGKTIFPGCYWFRSDHSGGLPEQFRDLPAGSVDCRAWTYDATKFQTPGQSCSMS